MNNPKLDKFVEDNPQIFSTYATVTFEPHSKTAWLAIGEDEQAEEFGSAIIGAVATYSTAELYLGCQTCLVPIEPSDCGMCHDCRQDLAFRAVS